MKRIKTCSVDGCDSIHYGRGLCEHHYHYQNNRGDFDLDTLPTPHDQCHFVILRHENDRWRKRNEANGYHRDWQHSALYIAAHAVEQHEQTVA